jgi:MerR family transcriptional regulator, redox-sensitive transcriptional activator SoxR
MSPRMTIGEVARQGGLRASAIRFYEKSGLLPKPLRSGGQRRYDSTILERLAVLERAKDCGFTLEEVRMLFNGFRADVPLSKRWQDLARKKIAELDALSERIAVMKDLLERAQRCRCMDSQECGRRILAGVAKR